MIGKRICQFRKERGMTQAELGAKIHVSASAVGMYEQNRRVPNLDVLILLSECLGVSLDELVKGYSVCRVHNPD